MSPSSIAENHAIAAGKELMSFSSSDSESLGKMEGQVELSKEEIEEGKKKKSGFLSKWKKWIFCVFFLGYTIAACVLSSQRDEFGKALPILIIFCLYLLKRICTTFRAPIKKTIRKPFDSIMGKFQTSKSRKIGSLIIIAVFVVIILGVVISTVVSLDDPMRFVGFGGLALLYLIGFICSKHKRSIHLRPIVGALIIQFFVGLLVMRTTPGYVCVKWLSDIFGTFLGFVSAGSQFIFGSDMIIINPSFALVESIDGNQVWGLEGAPTADGTISVPTMSPANFIHYFAFMVIPTVTYFGAFSSLLYHAKLIQPMIKGIGFTLGGILGTSIPESVNAAGNIFLGQTEAPLLIRPFLADMSTSEIHAVMVGGFSTVSGGIMSAYMGLGVPAAHLISSVVMSSAGSLGMAKLLWPEVNRTEGKKKVSKEELNRTLYGSSSHGNLVEAAAAGASDTIGLALNIGAMLIAFLSIIAAFNALLNTLCLLVNIYGPNGDPVTIELIFGYIFAPIVFCMGVTDWSEAMIVGQFIGVKLMATEMTAYIQLSEYLSMNDICNAGLPTCVPEMTLSDRAVLISSYALCGFGNFGSVGIMVGGLTPMAPNKRKDITKVVGRALIGGTLCNLMVATIAGIIEDPTRSFD